MLWFLVFDCGGCWLWFGLLAVLISLVGGCWCVALVCGVWFAAFCLGLQFVCLLFGGELFVTFVLMWFGLCGFMFILIVCFVVC